MCTNVRLCVAILLVTAAAGADPGVPQTIRDVNNTIGASIAFSHFDYTEMNHGLVPDLPDTLDSESGWLHGFRVEAKIERSAFGLHDIYIASSVGYLFGDVTYDGRTQATSPGGSMPVMTTSHAGILEGDVTVGVGLPLGTTGSLTPVLRYGLRHWRRDIAPGQSDETDESYFNQALSFGAIGQIVVAEHLVLGIAGTAGVVMFSSVDVAPDSPSSITLNMGATLGLRGTLSIDYAVDRFHFSAAYDLNSFGYNRSDSKMVGQFYATEPDSSTLTHELRAGFAIGF